MGSGDSENADVPGQPARPGPDQSPVHHNARLQLSLAIISALAAIAVALISVRPWHHDNPCPTPLVITSPSAGQSALGAQGVKVIGQACGLNGSTGWLFDYDTDDEYYYMDYPVSSPQNAAPVVVNNGGWAYDDAPIGSPGDEDKTYGITVVLASPACTAELKKAKLDASGDIRFKAFPSGCQVEQTVDVVVTYPS